VNHTTRPRAPRTVTTALVVVLLFVTSVVALFGATSASAASSKALIGTFSLTPGTCSGSTASGTYLRMILPSGTPTGPYMSNSDSVCHDQSFTALKAGTDGGLITGAYQAQPSPPFDAKGNALAGTITAPTQFYGTSFATSSNKVDPQTHLSVSPPSVIATGSTLHATLPGFAVTWNNQYFNQGAPKPDGSSPGNTRAPTGTYNASTGAFTLSWTSQVVGGPFDKFTGQWHLQGFFHAAGSKGGGVVVIVPKGSKTAGAPAAGATTAAASGARSSSTSTPSSGASTSAVPSSGTSSTSVVGLAANGGTHGSPAASSSSSRTHTTWHVSGWLLALLILIAVFGFAALLQLNRAPKPAPATTPGGSA
jgi:hypothetical protein